MAIVKLTRKLLERIIKEERAKLRLNENFGKPEDVEKRAKDTEELDADELGTDKALEQPIDHMKVLKIREAAFLEALAKLSEARTKDKSKKDEAAKKKADKKKADDKKAKAKKEAQDKSKKSKKNESVRSVKMNETQLVEALRSTRAKIALLKKKG